MNKGFRWYIIGMVILINMVNYFDRTSITYASQYFITEYGLNAKTWGEVLGFFGYGYAAGAALGGTLADKKGAKFVWLLVASVWSLVEIFTPYAGDIGIAAFGGSALLGLAVFRIVFGLAEGPTAAISSRSLQNWSAPKDRGFTAAMALVGVPGGAMLGAPVSVGLLVLLGVKGSFLFLGVVGFIWILIWRKIFTNMPENNKWVSSEELAEIRTTKDMLTNEKTLDQSMHNKVPWYEFFQNRTLVLNAIGYWCFMYINFVLLTWTPKYLQDVFHLQYSSLWYLGAVPWIGATITVLLGGKISDKLKVKTGSLRIARGGFAAACYVFTAISFFVIPYLESYQSILFMLFVGNALNYLPNSVHWSAPVDIEPDKAGTFGGITHGIANTSAVVGPTLSGYLVYNYGYPSIFYAAGCVITVGIIAMLFVGKKRESIQLETGMSN